MPLLIHARRATLMLAAALPLQVLGAAAAGDGGLAQAGGMPAAPQPPAPGQLAPQRAPSASAPRQAGAAVPSAQDITAPATAAAPPGLGRAADSALLAQARGGSDSVSNEARLNGLVSGNAAVNVASGANIVDGGAFSNAAGIPIVIQNSGANVLIQNATIVNLQLK